MIAHQRDQAVLFLAKRPADRLLHKAIARQHDAAFLQVVQKVAENIDGLAADPGCLLGFDC